MGGELIVCVGETEVWEIGSVVKVEGGWAANLCGRLFV